MTNENTNEIVQNPKIVGAVDIEKIELRPFNGKASKIEKVEIEEHAEFGKFVKVSSLTLEGSPKDNPIIATKVLGLIEVKNKETGEVEGYGWGKESKTAMFLKKYNVENLNDLIGQPIVVIFEYTKKGKEVLTF